MAKSNRLGPVICHENTPMLERDIVPIDRSVRSSFRKRTKPAGLLARHPKLPMQGLPSDEKQTHL